MICPSCKHENREGARFCGNCGADLEPLPSRESPAESGAGQIAAPSPVPAPETPPAAETAVPPSSPPAGKGKKEKDAAGKKKRRRFPVALVVILSLLLIAFVWVGVSLYGSHLLGKALPSSPFVFEGPLDSENYVSRDFTAGGAYALPKGFGKLHWSCRSEYVSLNDREDGTAEADVRRPADHETVRVFVTCRYLFGIARKSYTLQLAPKPTLTVSAVKTPDESMLRADTTVVYTDETGVITDISGDLGDVTISCAEDAETVARAYRRILAVPDSFEIVCEHIMKGTNSVFYQMDLYEDGYPLMGEYISVATGKDGTLFDVKSDVHSRIPEPQTDRIEKEGMDEASILEAYAAETGKSFEKTYKMDPAVFYFDGTLMHGYYAVDQENKVYDVLVEAETGKVVYCEPDQASVYLGDLADRLQETIRPAKELYDSLEPVKVKGYAESDTGKEHLLTADGAFSPATEKYYLIDPRRNIFVEKSSDFSASADGRGSAVSSDTDEFSDSVSLEALKWIQDAYDWFEAGFSLGDVRPFGIRCLTNSSYSPDGAEPYDGAACDVLNHLHVFPAQEYAATAAALPPAVYREYARSVVNLKHPFTYFWNASEPANAAVSEAYADVFGYWISEDTPKEYLPDGYRLWAMGPFAPADSDGRIYLRSSLYGTCENDQLVPAYPAYDGSDPLAASVYISNVACRMYVFGQEECGLSKRLTQDIWYDSMAFGYMQFRGSDINHIRRNVLKAAALHECTGEQLEYIEDLFFDVGIRDGQEERHTEPSYISGRLIDEETGLPVADAKLIVISGGDTRTVFTDSFGGFAVTGVALAGSRIECNSFGETCTLYPEITQFAVYAVKQGDDESAYSLPGEDGGGDEEDPEEIADLLAADDVFVVTIDNPLASLFSRKIKVSLFVTREYSEELQAELKADLEKSLLSTGDYLNSEVTVKSATQRMLKKVEEGEIPHGFANALPDSSEIEIRSFDEWWYYLKLYLGYLNKITFYVRGTGELRSIH
ncbi:MAG: zinc-ribbon domain-containing protein [Clostridia bacterium]|nr:zinc-ribbon domain-containing protein [Clostridia bacterium]